MTDKTSAGSSNEWGGVEKLAQQRNEALAKVERLARERDQATVLVGELAALIPIGETIAATRSGATMVQWFKDHLRAAPETSEGVSLLARVTLRSNRFGEFDLDELVDRLCHSHAPKPCQEDLYNAQIAILKLAEMLRAGSETSGSLLRKPSAHAPPGCHCTERCAAPVLMGRQQPCRDPEKAARLAVNGNPQA